MTPFGALTALFLMIPVLMLYMYLQEKVFAAIYIGLLAAMFLLTGEFGLSIVLFSLFFAIPAIVMGICYKRNLPASTVITFGILVIIVELTLMIIIISAFGPNVMEWIKQFIEESISTVPEQLQQGWDDNFISFVVTMMARMLPVYMFFFALVYVFVTHSLSRQFLRTTGISIAKLPPIKQWMLPRSLVWYYLIALVIDLFIDPTSGSLIVTVLWNVIPILTFAFVVQAISFLFYLADVKRWNIALPIAGIVVALFLPSIVSLLGVFDIAFKLRNHLKKH